MANINEYKKRNYHKLIVTTITLTIIGSLLMMAIFSVYLVNSYRNNHAAEREELTIMTQTAASRTENLVSTIDITMKLFDKWMMHNPDRDPRFDAEFNELLNTFRYYTGNQIDLRMVSESGGLFYLPSQDLMPLSDVSDREYYQMPKNSPLKTLFFAEPVRSRVTGNWGIPISYRLEPNRFGILAIFAVIEFRSLDMLFADLLTSTDRAVLLVRADNTVLFRLPYNAYAIGKILNYTLEREDFGQTDQYLPEKTHRTISFKQMQNYPVSVAITDNTGLLLRKGIEKAARQTAIALALFGIYLLLSVRQIKLLNANEIIQTQLETAAQQDTLTGLKNRRYFLERVADEMERAKRIESKLTLIIADIDHFKKVNDTYGHPKGDAVLKQIAEIIDNSIRAIDLCGRIGGEEFAILLTDTDIEETKEIAERIRASTAEVTLPAWTGGISMGAAEWKNQSESLDQLIKRADDALYRAKDAGRNRIVTDET